MRAQLRIALASLVFALAGAGVTFGALASIKEQLSAGHGPGPSGGSNGIYADHSSGESLTNAWIAGPDGPVYDPTNPSGVYWGLLETHNPPVAVSDHAWARDGSVVEASTALPPGNVEWRVQTPWRLRGQATPTNYWGPDANTGYSMLLYLQTEVADDTGNWGDLSKLHEAQRELEQETSFALPFESEVTVDETISGIGSVKFRYSVDMTAVGSISRGDMKVRVRGRVQGLRDSNIPANAGVVKLIDGATQAVLDQSSFH